MQTTETKIKAVPPDAALLGPLLARLPSHTSKGGQDAFYEKEEPVQVFSEAAGLGKNYAGYRITFRIKDGGEKRFNKFTTLDKGEIFPRREDPSHAEIAKFRADIAREAQENQEILSLIKIHPELQI
jgi:hypothetical protein